MRGYTSNVSPQNSEFKLATIFFANNKYLQSGLINEIVDFNGRF